MPLLKDVLANYQNPHMVPRTFPRDYSKRGKAVNSFAAAPFPVSSLCFRPGQERLGVWDASGASRESKAWTDCSSLLLASEFYLFFLSLFPVFSDLGLAAFKT